MKKELQEKFTKEYKMNLMQEFANSIARIGAKTGDPETFRLLEEAMTALLQYINVIDTEVIEFYKDTIKYYDYKANTTAKDAIDKMITDQFVSEMTNKEQKD